MIKKMLFILFVGFLIAWFFCMDSYLNSLYFDKNRSVYPIWAIVLFCLLLIVGGCLFICFI